MIINARCYADDNGNLCAGPEETATPNWGPEVTLDDIIVQEIFTLHDFRDWWRSVNAMDPKHYRYKMTRAEWEAAVRAYKKLKAAADAVQKINAGT